MKFSIASAIFAVLAIVQTVSAEVPQEHSHDDTITNEFRDKCLPDPGELPDVIFGLLGDKV